MSLRCATAATCCARRRRWGRTHAASASISSTGERRRHSSFFSPSARSDGSWRELRYGGTIYIDDGKPALGLIERTVDSLREIAPTIYFNVPRGYDMLLPYLQGDSALRANFFRRLDLIFYAAAALPQNIRERLEEVAIAARGERVRMVSSWGSTETAPLVTSVHFDMERAGVIGLPVPGVELKMVPNAGPLVCFHCGGVMRIIAFITYPSTIATSSSTSANRPRHPGSHPPAARR